MKVIWKYPINPNATVSMPAGATIINAGMQNGVPHIWAMVDPSQPKEARNFLTIPTGQHFDDSGLQYIGTFHGVEEWMVFHLFEEVRKQQ